MMALMAAETQDRKREARPLFGLTSLQKIYLEAPLQKFQDCIGGG